MTKKVLFITPYPFDESPSQRFRFEQFFPELKSQNYNLTQKPFLTNKQWHQIYLPGQKLSKAVGILLSYLRRFALMFALGKFDYIFIHREAAPLGPPFFEYIITHWTKATTIYDFDDAIWMSDEQQRLITKLKWLGKVKSIISWVDRVSVGNSYLAEYAKEYNQKVYTVPTSIRMTEVPAKTDTEKVVIGWTGTHSTLKYLESIHEAIIELSGSHEFEFVIICNSPSVKEWPNSTFVKWTKEKEWEDLNQIDIGIMPQPDTPWTKGKCGFKALQYMSLGKPVVCSPVGVNVDIVSDKTGVQATTKEEWVSALSQLLIDENLRNKMGQLGKETFQNHYSNKAVESKFMALLS